MYPGFLDSDFSWQPAQNQDESMLEKKHNGFSADLKVKMALGAIHDGRP